ncbi:MAG: alpha/beta hydrolase, partial [Ornithinimicrobium sp.]
VLDGGDVDAVTAHLVAAEPAGSADDPRVLRWCAGQAQRLMAAPVRTALTAMPNQRAVADPAALSSVRAPVLVIAAHGDPIHPVSAAERLGELLPHAHVEVLPEGGIMWAHRDRVRERVGEFIAQHAR